ncbi:Ger(x)C family spore germination protein [Paenibacillus sonchi]|uniref:Ger(x)C family spore germination protein n=1 Tax=Paenibacillus sonchi TaxID=373687 RepID=UPI001E48FF03|nr:Ger(x)C family spore germination protein [Paenibacillus sonchi]MCE3202256.1 Ger(x)C family spore germination protein [Paenibacillus sonchi]
MNKKRIVSSCLLLSLIFTSGCWDSTEVNELAIELAWGIDKGQDDNVMISAQVIVPSKISSGQGDGKAGAGQGKPFFVVSSSGMNTLDAVQKMQTKLSRRVFRGHRRVIVIGESLARHGIKDVLDTYTRDPNLKLRTDLFVVKGSTAREFLNISYPLETIPGLGALGEYDQIGTLMEMGFINFLVSASSKGSSPTVPVLVSGLNTGLSQEGEQQDQAKNVDVEGFRISGAGIFDQDLKLVGFLKISDARILRWVTGKSRKLTISTQIPDQKGNASMVVNNLGSKIRPVVRGNQIQIFVTLTGQGAILENNTRLDLTKTGNVSLLQDAFNKHVEESVLRTITSVQKKYGTDVFGFGDIIHNKKPSQWKSLKDHWDQEFSNAEVFVKADVKVRRIGVSGPSVHLMDDEIKR